MLRTPPPDVTRLPGVHDVAVEGAQVRFQVDTAHLDEALALLLPCGVESLVSQPPTLEELFLRHYGDQFEDATA